MPGRGGITGNETVGKAVNAGLNQAVTAVRFPATDLFSNSKQLYP